MVKRVLALAGALALFALPVAACGDDDDGGGGGGGSRADEEIVIGWTPPDITGVFKTATDFFERAADDANKNGFDVKVISRSPATHTAFADQLAIIENFISQQVDVIAVSPADTEAIKPAIKRANEADIPVIMVNLLEPQDDIEVASYIGFDNSEAASVSAYAVLDYFGGPGVLGSGPKVEVSPDQFLDLDWWEQTYADADKNTPKASGTVIEGIAGTFFSEERLEGFEKVVSQYPNIKIPGKPKAADWNSDKGVLDDSGGETPPAKGKVAVFTNDVTPESTDAIRDGKLIAETHHGFPEWGWFGTEFAVKLACGQEVPKTEYIRPRTVYQGNADQFYPEPKLPPIDWKKI